MGNYAVNAITGKLDRVGTSGGGGGNVVGPDSSIDGNIVIFDGATGKLIKDTGISSINPTFTGDLTAANLNLPQTTASVGKLNMNGLRYLHSGGNVSNTFLGSQSGNTTNTSDGSTGIGQGALQSLTSGISNTAVGHVSLDSLSTGAMNSCFGEGTMFQCGASCTGNTAVGWHALIVCQGNYNVAIGQNPMGGGVQGQQNVGIGYFALNGLINGNFNTCIGPQAGSLYNAGESNNLCLNHLGVTGESNVTRIGNSSTADCFLYGVVENVILSERAVVIDPTTDQMGVLTGKPMVSIESPVFSIVGGGTHVLMTLDRDLIINQIYSLTVNSVGAAGDSQSSVGYNSPAYDNLISGGIFFPSTDDGFMSTNLGAGTNSIVPSGTLIALNVNTPDSTATTYDVKIFITGFYV